MAKASIETIQIESVILKLSAEEAHYLKSLLQNPIGYLHVSDEPEIESDMRQSIFNALPWKL